MEKSSIWKRFRDFFRNEFTDAGNTISYEFPDFPEFPKTPGSSGFGSFTRGKGPLVSETRVVGPFDRIHNSLMFDTTIVVGEPQSVKVFAQKNLLSHIKTVVEDGQLMLHTGKESYRATAANRVEVTVPTLTALDLTGHGNVRVSGVRGAFFRLRHSGMGSVTLDGCGQMTDLDLSGHGKVDVTGIAATTVHLRHTGMNSVRLVGSAKDLDLQGSGHGNLYLGSLVVKDIMLTHSGMGRVELNSYGTVRGHASGHGDLRMCGTASWRVRHTGMGDVSFG